MKDKSGITLVALVVTIILLIMLAGATLSYISSDDGILKQAISTSETTKITNLREAAVMIYNDKMSRKYLQRQEPKLSEVIEELKLQGYEIDEFVETEEVATGLKLSQNEITVAENDTEKVLVSIIMGKNENTRYRTLINSRFYEIKLKNKNIIIERLDNNNNKDNKISVSTDNPAIATATVNESEINVKGKNKGETFLKVSINDVNVSVKVKIKKLTQNVDNISDTNLMIDGGSFLKAKFTQENTSNEQEIVWSSSNPEIATVTQNGIVMCGTKTTTETGKKAIISCKGKNTRVQCVVESTAKIVFTNDSDENKTANGKHPSDTNPIIPAGYSAIDTKNAKWNLEGKQSDINKGLVIMDENGNNFVWVPVPNNVKGKNEDTVILNRYDTDTKYYKDVLEFKNISEFEKKIKNDYKSILECINKYKGFYIGRYETSINKDGVAQSIANIEAANSTNPNIKNWYKLYKIQTEFIKENENIISTMISGCQYDLMIDWMSRTGIAVNSENPEEKIVRNRTEKTGNNKYEDILNNIYDIYGCNYEWTLEADGMEKRVERGGNFDIKKSPDNREGRYPDNQNGQDSSRITLCMF